jgi:hypothetical protein
MTGDVRNLSEKKLTWQSSTYPNTPSHLAVDGGARPHFFSGVCSSTDRQDNPWWAVDLGQEYEIAEVLITNRGDCCGEPINYIDTASS